MSVNTGTLKERGDRSPNQYTERNQYDARLSMCYGVAPFYLFKSQVLSMVTPVLDYRGLN